MTFLEKLDRLMAERGLNKHMLSEQCGIPYTTITGMYVRGTDKLQLSTIQKLCAFFEVPVDYMVFDKYTKPSDYSPSIPTVNERLSAEEKTMIEAYRNAEDLYRQVALELLEAHPRDG